MTIRVRARWAGVLGATLVLLPGAGRAAPTIRAPYEDATTTSTCGGIIQTVVSFGEAFGLPGVQLVTCHNIVTADKETGALALDLSLATEPVPDLIPSSRGEAAVLGVYEVRHAVPSLPVAVKFHVNSAQTESTGLITDTYEQLCCPLWTFGSASVFALVTHDTFGSLRVTSACPGCTATSQNGISRQFLAGPQTSVSDQDVELNFVLTTPRGDPIPEGLLRITAGLSASVDIPFDLGSGRVVVDASATEIQVG